MIPQWINRLNMDLNIRPLHWDELLVEGWASSHQSRISHANHHGRYMIKVQPMCTTNTTRWFILTVSQFMYLKEEAGELMR